MNWNYDELFAPGNIIGVERKDKIEIGSVSPYNIDFWKVRYQNNSLSYIDSGLDGLSYDKCSIQWIVRMNDEGEVAERIFDRDEDMADPMPELKTGMFVEVDVLSSGTMIPASELGVVVDYFIAYENGGYSFTDTVNKNRIKRIWPHTMLSFDGCKQHPESCIWERNN